MQRESNYFATLTLIAGAGLLVSALAIPRPAKAGPGVYPVGPAAGVLAVVDRAGRVAAHCPLKQTAVDAAISGPLARVTVTQIFENRSPGKIEAIYVFPLPHQAAVDDMTITAGDRTIKGTVKRRSEARAIYDDARRQGHVAALLEQERPNVFTQAVTNIAPGAAVKVVISYVETVPYEAGSYRFAFPMVVGPRYLSGSGAVTDAGRISPPVAPPGLRAGHDISLNVKIEAGVAIESLASTTHEVLIERPGPSRAVVRLKNGREIPNRDFLLNYDVAGRSISDAVLTHRGSRGGFFTLLLQPPDRVAESDVTPKELVFVLDTSGSMAGFPIEKSKEVIKLALDNLHARDTFNLITFAGDTHVLFPQPVAATPDNVRKAQQFLLSRRGSGGTEMMKAIRAALDPSDQQDHVRVVCFLTDGYIGNDMEVVGEVRRHPNARVFSFGIGSSVNRFLLDKMAEAGRGEVEYVGLSDDGSAAAKRFHERVRNPLLTDIEIDWNGLPVVDVHPARHPDLFAAKPLLITGRYERAGQGTIRLHGRRGGARWTRELQLTLPNSAPGHEVLATLWARTRIEHLMSQDWSGLQHRRPSGDLEENITRLGLEFRLMTQFTSFVAVEDSVVVSGAVPARVEVPVELPHGVSRLALTAAPAAESDHEISFSASGSIRVRSSRKPVSVAAPEPGDPIAPAPRLRDERKMKAAAKIDEQLIGQSPDAVLPIKLWLNDDSVPVLARLKALGVTVTSKLNGKIVLGSIRASQLALVAALAEVDFISKDLGRP